MNRLRVFFALKIVLFSLALFTNPLTLLCRRAVALGYRLRLHDPAH